MEDVNKTKKMWRPVFAWTFIVFYALTGIVILGMLMTDKTTIEEASNVLVVMLGAGGGVTGVYAAGRTFEKHAGKADDDWVPPDEPYVLGSDTRDG